MSNKLPPCRTPWCDHSDPPYVWQGPDDLFTVICGTCRVEGPYRATEAEARDAWEAEGHWAACDVLATAERKHEAEVERLREAAAALDKALGGMLTFYGMDEEPREVSGVVHEAARKARVQYAAVLGEAR